VESQAFPTTSSPLNLRRRDRLSLPLPVRLRWLNRDGEVEDLQISLNFSRDGLYFHTRHEHYRPGMRLRVTFPYRADTCSPEYAGQVVRVDLLSAGGYGVAVRFLYIESQAAKAASARA